MNVLGISGSPKRAGLTELLLDKALEGARSVGLLTEKIIVSELDIKPCRGDEGCSDTGECETGDDMKPIREKIGSAGAVIIATPIYFGSVSAQLKTMIDRFQPDWVAKYVLKKAAKKAGRAKGLLIGVAGQDKKEYFENARLVVRLLFATLNIDHSGELFLGGTNSKTPAQAAKNEEALAEAFRLGAGLGG